jgi:hypothetical protein
MTETGYDAFYLFFQLDRVGCLILILVYFKEKSQTTSTKLFAICDLYFPVNPGQDAYAG